MLFTTVACIAVFKGDDLVFGASAVLYFVI